MPATQGQAHDTSRAVNIMHYYALGRSHQSGVTSALNAWAVALRDTGANVHIVTGPGKACAAYYSVPSIVIKHKGSSRRSMLPSLRELARQLRGMDLLILHEGWTISHYVSALVAAWLRVPYIVMPHGAYQPEVMAGLGAFKRTRFILEARLLRKASGVHVFFASEIQLVRALAPAARCIVAPTGCSPDEGPLWTGEGDEILWFGRLDMQHKGLDLLLMALAAIPCDRRPKLRLAGVDYLGGRKLIDELVAALDLRDWVRLTGPIHGEAKVEALRNARAYVHPSRWECYGVALLEALAAGAPVLASASIHAAPMLRATRSAELVAPCLGGWVEALDNFLDFKEPVDRSALWEYLNWPSVATTALGHYRTVIGA
ncbi:MAG: glycosyltransferase [Mycobacteriales bacterium]